MEAGDGGVGGKLDGASSGADRIERPGGMLAHHRLLVMERAREHLDVLRRCSLPCAKRRVAEHHRRIPLQPAQRSLS